MNGQLDGVGGNNRAPGGGSCCPPQTGCNCVLLSRPYRSEPAPFCQQEGHQESLGPQRQEGSAIRTSGHSVGLPRFRTARPFKAAAMRCHVPPQAPTLREVHLSVLPITA